MEYALEDLNINNTLNSSPKTLASRKNNVFSFIDFKGRTHNFYNAFAKETIENDIIREQKLKRRILAKEWKPIFLQHIIEIKL